MRGRTRAAPVWIWEVDIARFLPFVSNWEAPDRLGDGLMGRTLPLLEETRVEVASSSSSAITSTGLGSGGRLPMDRFSGRDNSSVPRLFELLRPTRRLFSSLNT